MSHLRHINAIRCIPQRVRRVALFKYFLCIGIGLTLAAPLAPNASGADIADAQESHPGIGMEAKFAEAVIAYNRKQMRTAIVILDELIEEAPRSVEYLELKALILKTTGDVNKSFDVYKQLYKISDDKNRGPYAFEIGTLYDKAGKPERARPFFKKSLALGFNVDASHLYLGLGYYKESLFPNAEEHFKRAATSEIPDIELVARYYLGITMFKLNNSNQGIQEFVEVKKLAEDRQNDELAKNIKKSTGKMLEPFSRGQWFGNVAILSQFDSNVQQLPSGSINPAAGVNPATLKANLSGGGGYMSAPIDTIQWVAGYRASFNYNFNADTKQFQYFTNSPSLYLNYRTLARTSAGLKLEGHFTFQNTPTDATLQEFEYLKYSLIMGGGPYIRHQLSREWRVDGEFSYRKQTFYIDPNLSGTTMSARATIRNESGARFWNPGFSVVFENNATNGFQFYYNAYGVSLMNNMNLPAQITLSQSLDVLLSDYTQSNPKRVDQNYVARVGFARVMNSHWSLLGDVTYIDNRSTIPDSFSYSRFLASLGVGYTF